MDAHRVLKGDNGKQQPFMNQPGVEVSTEGDSDCVQNKKAKKAVILCSGNSTCSDPKCVISLFLVGDFSQSYTLQSGQKQCFLEIKYVPLLT